MSRLRAEDGVTMGELLMGMVTFMIILTAIMTMVQASVRNQDRVAERVAANQRARPVMTRIIDALHSACVAPGIAPIQAGSTGNQISFLSKAGSAVSPFPDRRVITLSNGTLSESVYASTGGQAPAWTFSTTPLPPNPRELLAGVGPGLAGNPSVPVPLFRYYAYVGGAVSATPLSTPLSAQDAARTVQVDIAFAASPGNTVSNPEDPNAPVTLQDSTTLRLEPASEDSAEVNLPCV